MTRVDPDTPDVSPLKLILTLAVLILATETLVTFLLELLAIHSPLADALILTALIFPVLYLFVFRPMAHQMAEHQRAVATLAESEARTRQIIEGAVDAFIAMDARGVIIDWNTVAKTVFGWSHAEALGRNLNDMIIPPQMQEAHRSGIAHFLATGEGPVIGKRLELVARHRDGHEFPVETTISAIRAGDSWRFTAFLHDITQRRKLETGMRRSESRYRALFESSRDAIMTLEPPAWKFTSGNTAAVAMFRTRDEEHFVALGPWEMSPERQPDGRASEEKAREMIETAMRDGSHFFEWTHRRFNGESFPCTVLLSRMETDGTMFLQATVRDITERKQMGEKVAHLSRQLRSILDSAGEGILGLDLDGKHTFINPVAATMLGYEVKELAGKPSHSTWHHTLPDGTLYPQEDCPIYRAFKDGLVHHVDTEVFWRKDGTSFPVDYTSTPVRDEQGALQGAVVVFHDITEQKQAEDELREKERLLSDSQRHGHIGSWFYDMKGPFKWSKEMYRLYGVSPDTFTPTPESLLSLIHPEDRQAMQAWLTVCAAGAKHELVFRIKNPDGTIRFILGRGESFHDADSRLIHMAGTVLDITELKRAEEALRAKNKELEQFTYAVSHDLRSPLVTIQTFHRHLEQDIAAHDTANVAKDLDFIQTATGKMGQLLDELANLLRVGLQSNPQEDVPLQDVVKEVVALVAGRITRQGVPVTVLPEAVSLRGDRAHFVAIFQNLVDNACKFMGDQRAPRIEIGMEMRGAERVFFVRDNGAGINAHEQEEIFGLFVRLNPQVEGTGLGLALVKRIVELYDGRIWVESAGFGQGACFYFTLPGSVKKANGGDAS